MVMNISDGFIGVSTWFRLQLRPHCELNCQYRIGVTMTDTVAATVESPNVVNNSAGTSKDTRRRSTARKLLNSMTLFCCGRRAQGHGNAHRSSHGNLSLLCGSGHDGLMCCSGLGGTVAATSRGNVRIPCICSCVMPIPAWLRACRCRSMSKIIRRRRRILLRGRRRL